MNKNKKSKKRPPKKHAPAATMEAKDSTNNSTLSLAMRLKRERGTASTTPLPPEWRRSTEKKSKYLTPEDGDDFDSCQRECYRGFIYENPKDIPRSIHDAYSSLFNDMNDSGLFLYDVVQPGGKKLSLTSVTRTLVGNPGSTYKYLGLRLFSHPWCDVDENGDGGAIEGELSCHGATLVKLGYSKRCARALIDTGLVNKRVIERTNKILQTNIAPLVKDGLVGSADYSLTLINKMEPFRQKKDLKNDSIHGLGKTSVSWHKDSGLQDFSSIAVYHQLQDLNVRGTNEMDDKVIPWKVALRVADSNTRTPALSIPLPSGSLYYLMDDFNHCHEHAVISGSDSFRYSSTHRVARDGAGTWKYIREKCKTVLLNNLCVEILKSLSEQRTASLAHYDNTIQRKMLVKEVRSCHQLMTEIEFEWIRQWYIQGKNHSELHYYWIKPIAYLEDVFIQLQKVISCVNNILKTSSTSRIDAVSEDLFDVTIEQIENRRKLKIAWESRLKDSIFKTLKPNERPLPCIVLDKSNTVDSSIVREWRRGFVSMENASGDRSNSKKRKAKDKTLSLTKKGEKKSPSLCS